MIDCIMSRPSTLLMDLGEVLFRRQEWSNRAEIADAMDVSQQVLSRWLNYLEFYRVLRVRDSTITVSEDRLLSALASYRAGNLRPERPKPIQGDAEEIHARLDSAEVPHAFGMFTAANEWAFYEPHRHVQVYVAGSDRTRMREALEPMRPQARQTRQTGSELQVFHEALEGVATQEREGLPVTTPFQTVVDLRAHPEGGAHADFLESNLLPRLEEAIG